jgi:hypothetical protein
MGKQKDEYRSMTGRQALARARELGFSVQVIHGHTTISKPGYRTVHFHSARKDASRKLASLLRQEERRLAVKGDVPFLDRARTPEPRADSTPRSD